MFPERVTTKIFKSKPIGTFFQSNVDFPTLSLQGHVINGPQFHIDNIFVKLYRFSHLRRDDKHRNILINRYHFYIHYPHDCTVGYFNVC